MQYILLTVATTCLLNGFSITCESIQYDLNDSSSNGTVQTHNVAVVDNFVQLPTDKRFKGGGDLLLKCTGNGSDLHSNIIHTTWFRNHMRIRDNDFVDIVGKNLIISVTTGDDIGIYTCKSGFNIVSAFNVSLEEPYFSQRLPKVVTAHPNSEVEFVCDLHFSTTVSNNNSWSVLWLHNGNVISKKWETCKHNRYFSCGEVKNGTLSLKNIQVSDKGVYTCKAENYLNNRSFSLNTTLDIQVRLRFQDHWLHQYQLKNGSKLELTCSVNLKGGYVIVWEKNGKVLVKHNVSGNAVSANGRFIIHNVNASDSGLYTCTVHAYTTISQSTKVLVADKISVHDNSTSDKENSAPSWNMKDQVILGFLCILTLSVSAAATIGTMMFCHRYPHFCNQCNSICRVPESTAYCYYIQHDHNNNQVPNRSHSQDSNDIILNDSHDHHFGKLSNACLSFTNPVFDEENDLHSSIHDVNPGDHGFDGKDGGCVNINRPITETRSLNSTGSEPNASGSDSSLNRQTSLSM